MVNLRNNREYREAVLTALGMTEDRDVENKVNFKSALLEALGVEHTRSDVVNFETFREKLIEGVTNYSGGGGESDFSTAEVTFSGINGTALATMPKIIDSPFDVIMPLQNEVTNGTYTIALYKGKTVINLDETDFGENVTISGDIELLEGTTYLVTGNCTITIS